MRSFSLLTGAIAFVAACGEATQAVVPSLDGGASHADASILVDGGDESFDGGSDASSGGGNDDAAIDAGPSVAVSIAIDPATKIGSIGPGFIGLSYEKSHLRSGFFRADNAPLVAMFKLLGAGVLRIGGNSVDTNEWQSFDGGAPNPDAGAPAILTAADVDALAAFASAAGWKVIYGVNMRASTPDVAADEAAYASSRLGASLYGFEIGNEVDLYKSTLQSSTWSYSTFKTQWDRYASAIRARVGATAPLTGPASSSHYDTWTVPFASAAAGKIELLTQHYYRGNGQLPTSTLDELLMPHPELVQMLDALDAAAKANALPDGYRLAECNSFSRGGAPGVSDAYGTALWVIDFLFTNAAHGSAGVNMHGGGNGPGYTPISDANGAVVGARAELYGLLLVALAGQGPLLKTTTTAAGLNFTAYAVGDANTGSTSVVVVNKDKTRTAHATVDLGVAATSARASLLTGPALDATTGMTLGGAPIEASGAFAPSAPTPLVVAGTTFVIDVPPASAALVDAKHAK